MVKVFTSKSQKSGQLGEDLAVKYLLNNGYSILDRNFTIKAGEIDIIAEREGTLYFLEVKSRFVTNILENHVDIKPEENITPKKRDRFLRTVEVYLASKKGKSHPNFKIQCLSVLVDKASMKVSIDILDF